MIFVDALSEDCSVVYANASFLKLTGYAETEIIGKPFMRIISDVQNGAPLRLKDCEKDKNANCLHYVNAVRSNGQIFPSALLTAPVLDDEGKTFQYFVCFVDLSEQAAEEIARQARLRHLYRHTPGFIATSVGSDHRITFANLAFRKLVGPRKLIGLTLAEAFPDLADQGFIELLDQVFESKLPYTGLRAPIFLEREVERPPERRVIDFIYEPIVDAEGEVTGIFCEGSDVTDVEHTENEFRLLQAQFVTLGRLNAMGTMAATLAHELNQPLAAISNYAAGCMALINDPESEVVKVQEGLEAIAAASTRAGQIIRGLRDMMKRASPIAERFDLAEALSDSIHLVEAGCSCRLTIAEHSLPTSLVVGDRVQVQQVMINLLKNACEAAAQQREGHVTATISKGDGEIKISITDDGPGISTDKQTTLFSWTESEKSEGMGMGLSISRTIIESQGGKIWLVQTSDQGSEFAFSLPAAIDTPKSLGGLKTQGVGHQSSQIHN